MNRTPDGIVLSAAPRRIWLWLLGGSLVGNGLLARVVGWLGGDRVWALQVMVHGVIPGFVLVSSVRWRRREPVRALTPGSSGWTVRLLLGLVVLAMAVDDGMTGVALGRWASIGLGFVGASVGGLVPPLVYIWRHRR